MKIYTKTGDEGITGLLGSRRVPKDDVRIEAYGTVDELNAVLGLARAQGLDSAADRLVAQLQDELFVVGSALADASPHGPFHNAITAEHAEHLESTIDALETELTPLTQFILPGGTLAAAQHPPGADGLPPRRAAGRQAVAPAGRRRSASLDRLPESTQRPLVRPGPRREPSRRRCRHLLERPVRW